MSSSITLETTYKVACHTDNVGPGSTFVAIEGTKLNGIEYIPHALERGARTLVVAQGSSMPETTIQKVKDYHATLVYVPNTRQALARLSASAYDYPASKLTIIGITGTKGKTTTCFLLYHFLRSANYTVAMISSAQNMIMADVFKTALTTPQPDFIHHFLGACVQAGVTHVVMEVAAQALSLHRVEGIQFSAIGFTNFDQEHLEFYASMYEYFTAKSSIFSFGTQNCHAFANADDPSYAPIKKIYPWVRSWSALDQAAHYVGTINAQRTDVSVTIDGHTLHAPNLIGTFSGYNILAAATLAHALGVSYESMEQSLHTFDGVPGRLMMHQLPNGARAYIDSAHNPSSFTAILSTLRPLTTQLIVIFGAGGERDRSKRPIMGGLAARFGDLIYITTDNPRTEDPAVIAQEIYAGIDQTHKSKVTIELDRAQAISTAYAHSNNNAILVLLGKGADEYQLIKGVKYPFSEHAVLSALQ